MVLMEYSKKPMGRTAPLGYSACAVIPSVGRLMLVVYFDKALSKHGVGSLALLPTTG